MSLQMLHFAYIADVARYSQNRVVLVDLSVDLSYVSFYFGYEKLKSRFCLSEQILKTH